MILLGFVLVSVVFLVAWLPGYLALRRERRMRARILASIDRQKQAAQRTIELVVAARKKNESADSTASGEQMTENARRFFAREGE